MSHYEAESSSHFMGAVVSFPVRTVPVGVCKYLVIDGQQRLTTIAILLIAIRDCAEPKIGDRINDYLVNRHYDGPDQLKVLPTHADREAYASLVLDRAFHRTPSLISDAYRFFSAQLKSLRNGQATDASKILEILERGLQVVMINLGEADDPYLIFESLNAKGEPLTQADLVRNYVLMKFRNSLEAGGEQERVYTRYWQPLEQTIGDQLPNFCAITV